MTKRSIPCYLLALCCMFCVLLLVGCSGPSRTTNVAPTLAPLPTSTVAPSPSPTPNTSTIFKGSNFSISYPHGWVVQGKDPIVLFVSGITKKAFMVEALAGMSNLAAIDKVVEATSQGIEGSIKNLLVLPVPPTVTVNSIVWRQKAIKGTVEDGSVQEIVMLGAIHGKDLFVVAYISPADNFELDQQVIYLPMLQSLQFAD